MSEPTTEAGRDYFAWVADIYGAEDALTVVPNILAIEAEARAAIRPTLDVERLAQMRQRSEFRFAATSDDFAREYAALASEDRP